MSGRSRVAGDLVVVGAGVMGAWTAYLAAQGGRRTTLLDAYGVGHPRATSGDESRIIRSSHGADELYTRWSRQARERWLELGERCGERLLVEAGVLWFAGRDDGFEAASIATLERLDVPAERVTAEDVRRRWPQVAIDDDEWAVFEPEGGLLLARRAVIATVGAFVEVGGTFALSAIRPGRAVGRRLVDVVDADERRREAADFVFACGPWLPRLFPSVAARLIRVTKQDVVFLGPPGGDDRYAADRLPCWVDFDAAVYGIPGVDGRAPKVAPDRYGPVFDPSHGERIVDPETVRLARAYAARRLPGLASAPVVETRVCQYEATPDTHFVIDRHPDYDNVWLVGGGSGHGFKHGPMIGATVVARLDGVEPSPAEQRFGIGQPREPAVGVRTGGDAITSTWEGY
jgi:glycine/D-amino acid oxidase-like deaminating enzyme